MGKSRRPSAQAGQASRGTATTGPRSGSGAGSALQEMLRRQAQNPRPGTSASQPPGTGQEKAAPEAREVVPREPTRHRH
jgi:hypothetical protein